MAFSFLFPGQGSQYTGMFKEHFEEFDEFQFLKDLDKFKNEFGKVFS